MLTKSLKALLLVSIFSIAACGDARYESKTRSYVLPAELKDCVIYRIYRIYQDNDPAGVLIVRCPNSSTTATFTQGKSTITTVTVNK